VILDPRENARQEGTFAAFEARPRRFPREDLCVGAVGVDAHPVALKEGRIARMIRVPMREEYTG
jgi:hypothetical protein